MNDLKQSFFKQRYNEGFFIDFYYQELQCKHPNKQFQRDLCAK